jgi:hypothetical protein
MVDRRTVHSSATEINHSSEDGLCKRRRALKSVKDLSVRSSGLSEATKDKLDLTAVGTFICCLSTPILWYWLADDSPSDSFNAAGHDWERALNDWQCSFLSKFWFLR